MAKFEHFNLDVKRSIYEKLIGPTEDTCRYLDEADPAPTPDGHVQLVVYSQGDVRGQGKLDALEKHVAGLSKKQTVATLWIMDCSERRHDRLPDYLHLSEVATACANGAAFDLPGSVLMMRYDVEEVSPFEINLSEIEIAPMGSPEVSAEFTEHFMLATDAIGV